MKEKNEPMNQDLLFGDRFWEQYLGKRIISDPVTAIVELVANCWDAGAKTVEIEWPDNAEGLIIISDDGQGMTEDEFNQRWRALSYDRTRIQGDTVNISVKGKIKQRKVYGKNGIGRFAAFCFAPSYSVKTTKNKKCNTFDVKKGRTQALDISKVSTKEAQNSGTVIEISQSGGTVLPDKTIRTELGRRFLIDPEFLVSINSVLIDFEDIKDNGMQIIDVPIPELNASVTIRVIDSKRTDRTVRQHGVAWHVIGRLVGECDWKDPEQRSLIDGRRIEAKRFTFVVVADILNETDAIKPDWSGFDENNAAFKAVNEKVQPVITKWLLGVTKEKRKETTAKVRKSFSNKTRKMTPLKREKWNAFVDKVAEECPSLTENELKSVSGVLANMELANSQYALLHKLHDLAPGQIDDLYKILDKWTVDMAKVVLDEIRNRMTLIEELRAKTKDENTLEVQELQPLFSKGLWIFGPEFETIHYTSNKGMTAVIQELFGLKNIKGSRNRPDFSILPDSSVGFYSYSEYDENGSEIGVENLVVIEIKAPSVSLGDDEKQQCWKYIRELNEKGLISERTKVRGYVLGKHVNPSDRAERTEMNGRVKILPLPFSVVLERADSCLLRLHEQIKSAPFMQEMDIDEYLNENPENSLPLEAETKTTS